MSETTPQHETPYRALVAAEIGYQTLLFHQQQNGGVPLEARDGLLQGALLDMAILALDLREYDVEDRAAYGFAIRGLDKLIESLLGFRVRVPHDFSVDEIKERDRYHAWRKTYLEEQARQQADEAVAAVDAQEEAIGGATDAPEIIRDQP